MRILNVVLCLLQECGYTFVEMNASSTRSKKSIQERVADQLKTCSILAYDTGGEWYMCVSLYLRNTCTLYK